LHPEGLLDLIGADPGIFAVLQEARALMIAHELDKGRNVRSPVLGEALEIDEDGGDAGLREKGDGVFGVLVEVRIEDALIHEVRVALDFEEDPAQVVELEHLEAVWIPRDGRLDALTVVADRLLAARLHLRDDREAMARGGTRIEWTVSSLFKLKVSLLRNRRRRGSRPVALLSCVGHVCLPFFSFYDQRRPGCVLVTRQHPRERHENEQTDNRDDDDHDDHFGVAETLAAHNERGGNITLRGAQGQDPPSLGAWASQQPPHAKTDGDEEQPGQDAA